MTAAENLSPERSEVEPEDLKDLRTPLQKQQDLLAWRRSHAWRFYSLGYSLTAIAEVLKVSIPTVSRDVSYVREQSRAELEHYIDRLPADHAKARAVLESLIPEVHKIVIRGSDERTRLYAANTLADIVMKLQALNGDPQVIRDAVQAVSAIRRRLGLSSDTNENSTTRAEQVVHGGEKV